MNDYNLPSDGGKLKTGNSHKHTVNGKGQSQGGKVEPMVNASYKKPGNSYAKSGNSYGGKT